MAALALAGQRGGLAQQVVRRFSTLAVGAVAVIGLTGLIRAYGELSAVGDLSATGYGRLLLIKSTLLTALVAIDEDPSVRLCTYVGDCEPEAPTANAPVAVTFRPLAFSTVPGRSVTVPMFKLAEAEE